jgi:hypothetical protein
MRSTQKPFSALWKVTRSIDPASTSVGCGDAWAGSVEDGGARAEVASGLTFAGSAWRVAQGAPAAALGAHLQPKADLGSRFACRLLLLPPVGGERPGLLDRIEVLIKLKVGVGRGDPPGGIAVAGGCCSSARMWPSVLGSAWWG